MTTAIEGSDSKGWQGQAAPRSSNGAMSGWNLYQVVAVGVGVAVSIQQIQTEIYGFRRVVALSERFQFKIPHITPEPPHPFHLYQKIYCTYSYILFAMKLLQVIVSQQITPPPLGYSLTNNYDWLFAYQQLKWPFWADEKNYIQIMTKNSSTWIKKLKNKKNRKENLKNPITKIKRKKIKYATQQVWVGVHIIP